MNHPDRCECGSCMRHSPEMLELREQIEIAELEHREKQIMNNYSESGYADRLKREAALYVETWWQTIMGEKSCTESRARELAEFEYYGSI